MKKLLLLLAWTCFCVVPVLAHAGNTEPTLYLEIYMYESDPDDPGPAPPEVCTHWEPYGEVIPCYSPKAPSNFGLLVLHIRRLDLPIAEGWPPPVAGGGYSGVTYGISRTGIACTYLSFMTCPGFTQGPGTAPGAITIAATSKCHDWVDHPGYAKYMSTTQLGASYFTIVNNADDGYARVINCQGDYDMNTAIGGEAQWGGTKSIVCYTGIYPVEATTWSKIKAAYR